MRGIFESLLVFGIMSGLLLPARLLFVEYVSDSWLGSFGVISLISITVIVLAKKNKLGFFGPMLERQVLKFQKGKKGIVIFGESIFLLVLLGGMIFAIDQGNTVYADLKNENSPNLTQSPEQVLEPTKNWKTEDWILGFLMTPIAFLTSFPEMSAEIASIDKKLDGWLMHFYTVGFVEYLEVLGILIYYRISFKRKVSKINSVLYSKAAV